MAVAAMVGLGVASATMQIMGANQEAKSYERQAAHNAQVQEQQADLVNEKQKLEMYKSERAIGRVAATSRARVAGAGLEPSGSPLAVMIDAESQMRLDQSTDQYNLEVQKRYYGQSASMTRWEGAQASKLTKWKGYTNAFSTLLSTGMSYMMYRSPLTQTKKSPALTPGWNLAG